MGAIANLPVGLAPGMGCESAPDGRCVVVPETCHSCDCPVNAYFAISIVGFNGTGSITYREALAAVFLQGWITLFISILGVQRWLARNIPKSLALATGTGIGVFIALIGLQPAGGLGVLGGDYNNLVGLGGCPDQYADKDHPYFCSSHVLRKPALWLGVFVGGFLTVLMMMYRVRGAFIIGILLVSIISWPRPTPFTVFPHTAIGDSKFEFFKKVVTFRPINHIRNALDYNYGKGKVWMALITFLYIDIISTCDSEGI
jgi:AGZA family xanthine/uracil permease-like MFS transporter